MGFAIILGFAIASTVCSLMEDGARASRVGIRALIYVILLSMLVLMLRGEAVQIRPPVLELVIAGVSERTAWFFGGGVAALCFHLFTNGHFHELWIKLHPQSAPTPEVQMGQRAQVAGFRCEKTPATLVGTSTGYLKSDLDLKTETLIRLCYSVFEDRSAVTLSRLESALHLGTGRRQRAFHKIIAGHRGRPKTKRIAHRYWRSVNGSSRLSQALFCDLCKLARDTQNRDQKTINRLSEVGTSLGLTVEEMGRAIKGRL